MASDPKYLPEDLYRAFVHLKDEQEVKSFLADLCTPQEIDAMAERWKLAELLDENLPYRQIADRTGASTATVTRVAKALRFGSGYRLALKRRKRREDA